MAGEWGLDIRWARGERGWLEIRDPADGRIYQVWGRDCPSAWRQRATVRLKQEMERRQRHVEPEPPPVYAF